MLLYLFIVPLLLQLILLMYIDDIVVTRSCSKTEDSCIDHLYSAFESRKLGALNLFLGTEVHRMTTSLHLSQTRYDTDLLRKLVCLAIKPCSTPSAPSSCLSLHDGDLLSNVTKNLSIVRGAFNILLNSA